MGMEHAPDPARHSFEEPHLLTLHRVALAAVLTLLVGNETIRGQGPVVAISAGERHSLAVRTDGSTMAWGDNFDGQLGDGSNVPSSVPVGVLPP